MWRVRVRLRLGVRVVRRPCGGACLLCSLASLVVVGVCPAAPRTVASAVPTPPVRGLVAFFLAFAGWCPQNRSYGYGVVPVLPRPSAAA